MMSQNLARLLGMGRPDRPTRRTRLSLEPLDGRCLPALLSPSPIPVVAVNPQPLPPGGPTPAVVSPAIDPVIPGRTQYLSVTLLRGVAPDSSFSDWQGSVQSGGGTEPGPVTSSIVVTS
jgi:hypothetical protein